MIDLSHLTEEEQGVIMTVLRRDAELKRAEEERIRKLQTILDSSSQADAKLKYLTGEWFYEAKSRRHMDKIHGSEIILASMKQRKGGSLDGSIRIEKPIKASSGRGLDLPPPPKPARSLQTTPKLMARRSEKQNLNSALPSPVRQRHNPFNRASLILIEPHDTTDHDSKSSEKEVISPLKSLPAAEVGQTSGGSITSEDSSTGFRPVPKKRTFLLKRNSSDSNGFGLDPQPGSKVIVPAPRLSLQRGPSLDSQQSSLMSPDETSQKTAAAESRLVSQSSQPSNPPDETSQKTLGDLSQVSSRISLDRYRNPPTVTVDRAAAHTRRDASPESEKRDEPSRREEAGAHTVTLPAARIRDSASHNNSSVGTATRQEELSVTHSTVDPPLSYDLNFIDKTDLSTKPNQKHAFRLTPQMSNPSVDEEDSISRVLEWISRSTDSSDWLKVEGGRETADRNADRKALRSEAAGNVYEARGRSQRETDNNMEQIKLKATGRAANQEANKTQDEVKKGEERERMRPREVKDGEDESQTLKISHLKSFWEKSNPGPKILISKSNVINDKGQKAAQHSVDKDERNIKNPHREPLVINPHNDIGSIQRLHVNKVTNQQADDPTYNSVHSNLPTNPHLEDRREPDAEILSLQARLSPDSESFCPEKPNPQTHSIFHSREGPLKEESSTSKSQLHIEHQARDGPGYLSRSIVSMDYREGGNDGQLTSKTQMRSEEAKMRNAEEQSVPLRAPPKRKDDTLSRDSSNGPHSPRQSQESNAERIKQLRSFWEQERSKPMFFTGKSKAVGDGRATRAANQAKLSKRFTKSEFDLTSVGKDTDSDGGDSVRNQQNLNVLAINQRLEKLSPSLAANRTQFNSLLEFWDEASSDSKGLFAFDKPKSPKRKEQICSQLQPQELKCADAEFCRTSSPTDKTSARAVIAKPSSPTRSKSLHDRQMESGSRAGSDSKSHPSNYETGEQRESARGLKDSSREEKPSKPQSSATKEPRSPKNKKDGTGKFSSRGNSLRRATSMFALLVGDEDDFSSQPEKDASPVHSQSRKGAVSRRSSEENETLTPRARAFVPRDYRHYLGMTDKSSVHTSLAPATDVDGSEGSPGYDVDQSGPVRTSTPVGSEERYGRRGSKTCQRPPWVSYSSSDTGQESSMSSTSETWSRNSSNRERSGEDPNPVRRALRRAEARPKNLTKSMEDITSVMPRQERRQDPTAEPRRISDVLSIPSPSSSFSDAEHLKKMSKSVPSFLEKESDGRDTDSTGEETDRRRTRMMGSSMTNLTSSSGLASESSLSGSVMTMYSADFGHVEVQGNIQFSINYVQKLREFHIFVAKCQDLAAVDPKRGRSDPYVKSYLVPDKSNLGKRKTSVKKKTLNPTFNEILRYRVRMEYLRTQTLILSVWHHDTFGRNSFLGEVDVDLSKWDFDHTQMNYLALKARTLPTLAPSNGRGEMKLAVRFLPQIVHSEGLAKDGSNTGEIHIWVKECKNLPLIRPAIDPYVKCFVLPDTSRKSRQKTRVLRRTVDPVFNHTMVYDGIREADLTEACVELTVWDRDRLAANLLGGLRLGAGTGRSYGALVDWMDSTPYEVALWERVMAKPTEWVEGELPLRMLTSAKTTSK